MSNDHNPHDEDIDKVLAALRDAAPPEGMEARIAQRLRQSTTASTAASSLPVRLPAGSALAGAWWRGAISGAAATTVAAGVLFFAAHLLRTNPISTHSAKLAANLTATPPAVIPANTSVSKSAGESQAAPCARQAILRVQPATPLPAEHRLIAETHVDTVAPSHPAPVLPLTAEERSLLQLAHPADPKAKGAEIPVLWTLSTTPDPDPQAKLEAQEADEFQKFFSPHQDPAAKENNKQN